MDMPEIEACDAEECSYNLGQQCHAWAITVGDLESPHCDTFIDADMSGGEEEFMARVGACKTSECMFNMHLECSADQVTVGHKNGQVDCLTFATG